MQLYILSYNINRKVNVTSLKRIRAVWLLYRKFELTVTFIVFNDEEISNNWQNSTDSTVYWLLKDLLELFKHGKYTLLSLR